jgi:hypothetical protein
MDASMMLGLKSSPRRKSAFEKDVYRSSATKRNSSGGYAKNVVKPSHRREMAHAATPWHNHPAWLPYIFN